MLHLDIRRPGRFRRPGHRVTGDLTPPGGGAGRGDVHAAIDGHSRVAFSCIQQDGRWIGTVHALMATLRHYQVLGVCFGQILAGNGAVVALRCLPGPRWA